MLVDRKRLGHGEGLLECQSNGRLGEMRKVSSLVVPQSQLTSDAGPICGDWNPKKDRRLLSSNLDSLPSDLGRVQ